MAMNSCKGCKDRHEACHDTCDRYAKDCDERERIKEKRKKEMMYSSYMRRQSALIRNIKRVYREKD